jgi:hypothetical protein
MMKKHLREGRERWALVTLISSKLKSTWKLKVDPKLSTIEH